MEEISGFSLGEIHSCADLTAAVGRVGVLPLLRLGVLGWSADEMVGDECRYAVLPDGGWEWPLWQWKGQIISESGCAYGKFIMGKAAFVDKSLWPDFCNWRRSRCPQPEEGSVEEAILLTLRENGEMITRELRAACGFNGTKMRGRFDAYITRLEHACRIVVKDFVYPHDRHGKPYGWGWALLTTPEALFGRDDCRPNRSPEESFDILKAHFNRVLPHASDALIYKVLG